MNNDPEAHTTVDAAQQPPITTENPSESDGKSSLFSSSLNDVGNGKECDDSDNVFNKAGENNNEISQACEPAYRMLGDAIIAEGGNESGSVSNRLNSPPSIEEGVD